MQQRIRSIKPEFFHHEGLFELERDTGLPIRLAFAGLWTCCDREGRFKWRPLTLKSFIMPYDNVDFSRVLDAMATRGFIVRYTSKDDALGFIPTWKAHQSINNREQASSIPAPPQLPEDQQFDASATREPRVNDASSTRLEGNRTEQNRTEQINTLVPTSSEVEDEPKPAENSADKPDKFGITPRQKMEDLKLLFAEYLEKTGRNPKINEFSDKKRKCGRVCYEFCLSKALRGSGPEEHRANAVSLMRICIDALVASDWHMGRDQKSTDSYMEWDKHLFKNPDKVMWWWNKNSKSTQAKPVTGEDSAKAISSQLNRTYVKGQK